MSDTVHHSGEAWAPWLADVEHVVSSIPHAYVLLVLLLYAFVVRKELVKQTFNDKDLAFLVGLLLSSSVFHIPFFFYPLCFAALLVFVVAHDATASLVNLIVRSYGSPQLSHAVLRAVDIVQHPVVMLFFSSSLFFLPYHIPIPYILVWWRFPAMCISCISLEKLITLEPRQRRLMSQPMRPSLTVDPTCAYFLASPSPLTLYLLCYIYVYSFVGGTSSIINASLSCMLLLFLHLVQQSQRVCAATRFNAASWNHDHIFDLAFIASVLISSVIHPLFYCYLTPLILVLSFVFFRESDNNHFHLGARFIRHWTYVTIVVAQHYMDSLLADIARALSRLVKFTILSCNVTYIVRPTTFKYVLIVLCGPPLNFLLRRFSLALPLTICVCVARLFLSHPSTRTSIALALNLVFGIVLENLILFTFLGYPTTHVVMLFLMWLGAFTKFFLVVFIMTIALVSLHLLVPSPSLISKFMDIASRSAPTYGSRFPLHVQRDDDTFATMIHVLEALQTYHPQQQLAVFFTDELAQDMGGPLRELIHMIGRASCLDGSLFVLHQNRAEANYLPRADWLHDGRIEIECYESFGKLLAFAAVHRIPIGINFHPVIIRYMILDEGHDQIEIDDDVTTNDRAVLLKYSEEELAAVEYYFSELMVAPDGTREEVDLIKNGRNIPVKTAADARLYVQLASIRTTIGLPDSARRAAVDGLRRGFRSMFRGHLFPLASLLTVSLVSELFRGCAVLDVEEWRAMSVLTGKKNMRDHCAALFWSEVVALDHSQRLRLFKFVTGLAAVPVGGFAELRPRFTLNVIVSSHMAPASHTCFNTLDLPAYETAEEMQKNLKLIIANDEGFGLV